MIRIDAIRELRRDLHMRPFEADRRVYLVLGAHLMNEDAADALLKDLEEPPRVRRDRARRRRPRPDPGDDPLALPARPVPAAVASARCARRSTRARRSSTRTQATRSRASPAGRLDRARAAARPEGGRAPRRRCSSRRAPSTASRRSSRPTPRQRCSSAPASARRGGEGARGGEGRGARAAGARGRAARAARRSAAPSARSCSRSSRSSRPGTATSSSSPSAPRRAAIHVDRLEELRADATRERLLGAERAAEAVRETWRRLEEFNLARARARGALRRAPPRARGGAGGLTTSGSSCRERGRR